MFASATATTPEALTALHDQLKDLPRPKLKLTGSDGNAFAVIGAASRVLRKAGWTSDQISVFTKIATSGDYNTVLSTCMKYAKVS